MAGEKGRKLFEYQKTRSKLKKKKKKRLKNTDLDGTFYALPLPSF